MTENVEAAFCALKMGIDSALAEIAEHSANHFGLTPDEINWADVGSLTDIQRILADVADRLAGRGEYAARTDQTDASLRGNGITGGGAAKKTQQPRFWDYRR